MPVIPLTITISLTLVFTFVMFFLFDHSSRFRNPERESLLPLNEETPRVAGRRGTTHARLGHPHDHGHAADGCGCHSGARPPCPGCLKPSTRRDHH